MTPCRFQVLKSQARTSKDNKEIHKKHTYQEIPSRHATMQTLHLFNIFQHLNTMCGWHHPCCGSSWHASVTLRAAVMGGQSLHVFESSSWCATGARFFTERSTRRMNSRARLFRQSRCASVAENVFLDLCLLYGRQSLVEVACREVEIHL